MNSETSFLIETKHLADSRAIAMRFAPLMLRENKPSVGRIVTKRLPLK
jgi:hypothetical protein